MQVILIGGVAQAGKTTLAKFMAQQAYLAGLNPVILPFAKPLKDAAEAAGFTKDKDPEGYRNYCQTHGDECRRSDPDYFVKKWMETVDKLAFQESLALEGYTETGPVWRETVVIVDDCRFINELAHAAEYNAKTVFVTPGKRLIGTEDKEWTAHVSEQLAMSIEDGTASEDVKALFHYRVVNEESPVDNLFARLKQSGMVDLWIGVVAESWLEPMDTFEDDTGEF